MYITTEQRPTLIRSRYLYTPQIQALRKIDALTSFRCVVVCRRLKSGLSASDLTFVLRPFLRLERGPVVRLCRIELNERPTGRGESNMLSLGGGLVKRQDATTWTVGECNLITAQMGDENPFAYMLRSDPDRWSGSQLGKSYRI